MARMTFEMSPDTRLIIQTLDALAIGAIATYDTLSEAAGGKALASIRPAIASARRVLLRDERKVFGVQRGAGLIRLADAAIVAAADSHADRVRRQARRAAVELTCVDFDKLSPADQLRHTTRLSVFTAVTSMTSAKGMKKIEAVAGGRAGELPIATTLKAFST